MSIEKINKIISDATIIFVGRPDLTILSSFYYSAERIYCSSSEYTKVCKKLGVPTSSLGFTNGKKIVFLIHNNITLQEFLFVAIHEILHIFYNHIFRAINKDLEIWQMATDHVVNRLCKEIAENIGIIKIPEGCVFFPEIHSKHPNCSAEDVYNILINQKNRFISNTFCIKDNKLQKEKSDNSSLDSVDESDNNFNNHNLKFENSENIEGTKIHIIRDKETGKSYIISNDNNPPIQEGETKESISNNIKEKQENIQSIWARLKGETPGFLTKIFNEIFKIEVPWNEILLNTLLYPLQNQTKKTWLFPNLTIPPTPLYKKTRGIKKYPRLKGKSYNKTPFILVAGLDSSASINEEELRKFIGILSDSFMYYKSLYVYIHDTIIHDTIIINSLFSEEQIISAFRKKGIKGRGGTSHKEVFDKIELFP